MAVVILCVVRQRRCRYTSFQFLTRQLMRRASISLTRFAIVTFTIFPVDPLMQCCSVYIFSVCGQNIFAFLCHIFCDVSFSCTQWHSVIVIRNTINVCWECVCLKSSIFSHLCPSDVQFSLELYSMCFVEAEERDKILILIAVIVVLILIIIIRTGWISWVTLEGTSHRTQITTARVPSSFATIRFDSTLQCSRCFGYLRPHNPRGRNVAVPALF